MQLWARATSHAKVVVCIICYDIRTGIDESYSLKVSFNQKKKSLDNILIKNTDHLHTEFKSYLLRTCFHKQRGFPQSPPYPPEMEVSRNKYQKSGGNKCNR